MLESIMSTHYYIQYAWESQWSYVRVSRTNHLQKRTHDIVTAMYILDEYMLATSTQSLWGHASDTVTHTQDGNADAFALLPACVLHARTSQTRQAYAYLHAFSQTMKFRAKRKHTCKRHAQTTNSKFADSEAEFEEVCWFAPATSKALMRHALTWTSEIADSVPGDGWSKPGFSRIPSNSSMTINIVV